MLQLNFLVLYSLRCLATSSHVFTETNRRCKLKVRLLTPPVVLHSTSGCQRKPALFSCEGRRKQMQLAETRPFYHCCSLSQTTSLSPLSANTDQRHWSTTWDQRWSEQREMNRCPSLNTYVKNKFKKLKATLSCNMDEPQIKQIQYCLYPTLWQNHSAIKEMTAYRSVSYLNVKF